MRSRLLRAGESRYQRRCLHTMYPVDLTAFSCGRQWRRMYVLRVSLALVAIVGRRTKGKMLMHIGVYDTRRSLPSPTVKFSVTFASQERVLSCPFLEARSLSLPTRPVASLPPPVVRSHLVSPDHTCSTRYSANGSDLVDVAVFGIPRLNRLCAALFSLSC